jgi:hypothetical protein
MNEFIMPVLTFAGFALVVSIMLWRTGKLRDLFNAFPSIDVKVEELADFYDKGFAELKKKLDELLAKLPK